MNDNGAHCYENINRYKVGLMLRALRDEGATVVGENPWNVDTRQSGVKLRGRFNEAGSSLEVVLVGKDWYVPSSEVWRQIDQLVRHVKSLPDEESAVMEQGTT